MIPSNDSNWVSWISQKDINNVSSDYAVIVVTGNGEPVDQSLYQRFSQKHFININSEPRSFVNTSMTQAAVVDLIKFAESQDGRPIIVQCRQGEQRSAGVAVAIDSLLDRELNFAYQYCNQSLEFQDYSVTRAILQIYEAYQDQVGEY